MEIMALYGGKLGCVAALRKKREILVWLDIWVCLRDSQVLVDFLFSTHFLILASHAMYMGRSPIYKLLFSFFYFIADSLHATKLQKIN